MVASMDRCIYRRLALSAIPERRRGWHITKGLPKTGQLDESSAASVSRKVSITRSAAFCSVVAASCGEDQSGMLGTRPANVRAAAAHPDLLI